MKHKPKKVREWRAWAVPHMTFGGICSHAWSKQAAIFFGTKPTADAFRVIIKQLTRRKK